ncbi:YccF domain-containing protein [Hoyosella altamirensis]|uniref:YccF domain-containing protein n=1 Tax=Hoyosella altamirensis TaxID=616997 RepID=UPI0007DB5849|nr:YccF domain-containing protein [Hoyosella altamirensis]
MRILLNIIWLMFGGIWLALGYMLAGIICFILIITIPFGIAAFRIAIYALWPFGSRVINKPTSGLPSFVGNIIWLIVAGVWLALGHIVTAFLQAITIIGIPLAIGNLKMIPISLMPLGKQIVPADQPTFPYPGSPGPYRAQNHYPR